MSTSIPTIMTKKGFVVQSSPPAEYVLLRSKGVTMARSTTPFCPRCGVSQHSHASGSDLDLFVASCQDAVQWGRRQLTVEVLR